MSCWVKYTQDFRASKKKKNVKISLKIVYIALKPKVSSMGRWDGEKNCLYRLHVEMMQVWRDEAK